MAILAILILSIHDHEICIFQPFLFLLQFISLISILFILFLIYFIDYAIIIVPFFSPLYSPLPCTPLLTAFPHLSSCPWVVHINSLASPFPIIFLKSPCLFTYQFVLLNPCAFSPVPSLSPPS